MVVISRVLFVKRSFKPIRSHLRGSMIDSLRIHCVGGTGGNGLPKFGGIGGQGGCVYCEGDENINLNVLNKINKSKKYAANHGEHSQRKKLIGSPGEDVAIKVPIGISIYSDHKKIGEINEVGEKVIVARGGPGGCKTNEFIGREGQNQTVVLDYKLIADVGFVGFPNAGKSTLLKALSKAKPRIAAFPFTTIRPNLGAMIFPDYRNISLADLPGLIEGAHINIGMGHRFLKHVERTKLLMFVADVQGFQMTSRHDLRSCFETILLLNKELELYNPDFVEKPALLVINKMDTEGSSQKFEEVVKKLKNIENYFHEIPAEIKPSKLVRFDQIIGVSAKNNGDDIKELKNIIRSLLDIYGEENKDDVIEEIEDQLQEKGSRVT